MGIRISKYKSILLAVLLNFIILLAQLTLFEPTPKYDDINSTFMLYGVYTGKYSAYTLYNNFLFSKLISVLMGVFPKVSWYYVIQYLYIFVSLTSITYILLKRGQGTRKIYGVAICIFFCAYELYIRFTFTQTAGILIIAGLTILFYLIDCREKKIGLYIWGIFLVFLGQTIRTSMYKLMIVVFLSAFVVFLYEHWHEKKELPKRVFTFALLVVGMYLMSILLIQFNHFMYCQDDGWKRYIEVNSIRADFTENHIADYDTYKDEYEQMGVSENDIYAMHEKVMINDYDFATPTLFEAVRNIEPIQQDKKISIVFKEASKGLLQYYFGETGFIILIVAIIYIFFSLVHPIIYLFPVIVSCLFSYYYMFYMGRTQHHVDVMVMIGAAVILLYYVAPNYVDKHRVYKLNILLMGMTLLYVGKHYIKLTSSSYYGNEYGDVESYKEKNEQNMRVMSLLSSDRQHFYYFGTYDGNAIYFPTKSMFEIPEKESYSNMAIWGVSYAVPDVDLVLQKNNISNVYKEITNSNKIYFCCAQGNEEEVQILEKYIQEHYNEDAVAYRVKTIGNLNIYRFLEKGYLPPNDNTVEGEISGECKVEQKKQNRYCITGEAYIKGINSFPQNIYLEIYDKVSGTTQVVYPLQTISSNKSERDKGESSTYEAEVRGKIDGLRIKLYLENGLDMYSQVIYDN